MLSKAAEIVLIHFCLREQKIVNYKRRNFAMDEVRLNNQVVVGTRPLFVNVKATSLVVYMIDKTVQTTRSKPNAIHQMK